MVYNGWSLYNLWSKEVFWTWYRWKLAHKHFQGTTNPLRHEERFQVKDFLFFLTKLLSVLRGHAFFSSLPQRPMTSNFEGFSIPDCIHYIYFSYLNSWERASIFPFECSVLNKGTTGTIFITSLVWRSPWTQDLSHSKPSLYHYATTRRRLVQDEWTCFSCFYHTQW